MTTNIDQAAQAATLNNDADIIIQEIKVPDIPSNFFESFKANSAAHCDSTGIWNIDVFPNFTPILIAIMIHALQASSVLEYRANAKCSPATICMYYLSVTYGFFLLNDLFVRKPPSAHARQWQTSTWRAAFADTLMTLPVPEFLQTILSQFHSSHSDRTKNVRFVPTAAGFSHNHFFGRFFPINMFAAIHDCTASLPGNAGRLEIYRDVFTRVLYTITEPAYACYIPELIGIGIDRAVNTTVRYINSKLYQVFNEIFNPVLFRDFQKRSSLANLNLAAPVFPTANVNAYDILFSATPSNLREITVVLRTLAVILKPSFGQATTLASFIDKPSGISILQHGYSSFALPTWVCNTQNYKAASFATVANITLQTDTERAVELNFLQRPAQAFRARLQINDFGLEPQEENPEMAVVEARPNRRRAAAAVDAPNRVRNWPWCLRADADARVVFPRHDNNALVNFVEPDNVTPPVLILDTAGDKVITVHLATLTGKIIESFEIDGSTVPVPDSRRPLSLQNALFADSAIPYRYTIPGTDFQFRAAGVRYPPLARTRPAPDARQEASSLLHDRTRIMLPVLNPHVADAALPDVIPGMTRVPGANFIRYIQSFFGFSTALTFDEDDREDAIPGMTESRLYVWSPYTYTCCSSDTDYNMDDDSSQRYFLTNLRTIFGTDYNLVKVVHPFEAMPIG
uniref:Putative CP n=1 Tax=Amaranthus cryptic virus 4 TaxID=2809263 RepID=A0A890CAX8_9VIRU|nr:putative CP [Amaranthus cryptic virus 4]